MKQYRLRWDKKIVGYAEETSKGILFKGKELLWFMRGKPTYNQIDEYIGIKDKLHRKIFELDIVLYRIEPERKTTKAIVLWEETHQQFVLYDVENTRLIPIYVSDVCLFENDKLEIVSHLFNHPELQKKINLKR